MKITVINLDKWSVINYSSDANWWVITCGNDNADKVNSIICFKERNYVNILHFMPSL